MQDDSKPLATPRMNAEVSIDGRIVYGCDARDFTLITPELWTLMLEEFKRNGRKTLTRAKVRELRAITRRAQ